MYAGVVNITVGDISITNVGGTITSSTNNYYFGLYDTFLNTTTDLSTSAPPFSTSLNLAINRDYYLIMGRCRAGGISGGNPAFWYNYADYNISIFAYQPDLNCTGWSACENGVIQRQCYDNNGRITPYVETQSCAALAQISFLRNLGFEDYTTYNAAFGPTYPLYAAVCNKPGWPFCGDVTSRVAVKYPINWSVFVDWAYNINYGDYEALENFVTLTQDAAREGSYALKMWYIPPKDDEPLPGTVPPYYPLTCGNSTVGRAPEVSSPYNQTTFIAANVSFPSPFMDLRFSVKRCESVPLQFDHRGYSLFGNPFDYCGFRCYGPTCNITPYGKYGVRLMDNVDNSLILDIAQEAGANWDDLVADLSGKLKANHNYTLAMAVNPSNALDPYSSCVYFDKVQATIRTANITKCEGYCDANNYTRYDVVTTDPCLYRSHPDATCAPASLSTDLGDVITGKINSTCIPDTGTLITYNTKTGDLQFTPNSPYCISIANTTVSPLGTTTPQSAENYINFLFSPMIILTIFMFIVAVPIAYALKSWQAFLFVTVVMAFLFSVGGFYPIYVAVVITVVAGLLLAYLVSKSAGIIG
jgi:hypothetical protein